MCMCVCVCVCVCVCTAVMRQPPSLFVFLNLPCVGEKEQIWTYPAWKFSLWINSILFLKKSEFKLIRLESSCSSESNKCQRCDGPVLYQWATSPLIHTYVSQHEQSILHLRYKIGLYRYKCWSVIVLVGWYLNHFFWCVLISQWKMTSFVACPYNKGGQLAA